MIPLHILGDTKPALQTDNTIVELLVGNVYWINKVTLVQPDVVLLWVGSPRQ